ncbi:MAG: hypothetical protein ACRD4S_14115 [Candidatus Acidiferrales bacterium]
MHKALWFAATTIVFMLPASARCQQPAQSQRPQQSEAAASSASQTQTAGTSSQTVPGAKQQDSLAAAARRAREQKKDAPKAAKVFTNDNIPTQGGISAVGEAPSSSSADNSQNAAAGSPAANSGFPDGNDEKGWRSLFAKLHHKLDQDQSELEILQRELGTLGPQYYSDPTKALMQGVTRSDINEKTVKIDQKKADVQADKQAISYAEDALRKAGGDRGWAE